MRLSNTSRRLVLVAGIICVIHSQVGIAQDVSKPETRLYWRDRCLASDDGLEDRFFASALTMVVTFAISKLIDFGRAKLDEIAKDQVETISAQKPIYLYYKGANGVIATPATGCLTLVKGTFEKQSDYSTSDPLLDTFSLPAKLTDSTVYGLEAESGQVIVKRLNKNDVPITDVELLYEVELIRREDSRSIAMRSRRLWVKEGPSQKGKKKASFEATVEISQGGTKVISEVLSINKEVSGGTKGDLLQSWMTPESLSTTTGSRLAISSAEAEHMNQTVLEDAARTRSLEAAWESYRKAKQDCNDPLENALSRRIQELSSPTVSVFAPVVAEVKVVRTEAGSKWAEQVSKFFKDKNEKLSEAIVGALPLPSVVEANAKKSEEERAKALSAVQNACIAFLGSEAASPESDQRRIQIRQAAATARKAGISLNESLAPACLQEVM